MATVVMTTTRAVAVTTASTTTVAAAAAATAAVTTSVRHDVVVIFRMRGVDAIADCEMMIASREGMHAGSNFIKSSSANAT
jgi:hypothetical protein